MSRRWAAACLAGLSLAAGCGAPSDGAPQRVSADFLQLAPPARAERRGPQTDLPTAELGLPDGSRIRVDVADTRDARETGLMFREDLPPDYGMLFVFERQEELQFWMKNTLVDLDMVFIDERGRISGLHERVPRSRRDTPDDKVARRSGVGRYVLELPAGAARRHGLKAGQKIALPGG